MSEIRLVPVHTEVLDLLHAALPSDTEILFLHKVSELLHELVAENPNGPDGHDDFEPQYMKSFEIVVDEAVGMCTNCLSSLLSTYALEWKIDNGR